MPAKKSTEQYEAEASWVGACLVHSASRGLARKLYQRRHGKLLSHIFVCHTCDNPQCILDAHHFPGTQLDNMKDASKKGRLLYSEARKKEHASTITKVWADTGHYISHSAANARSWKNPKIRRKRLKSARRPEVRAAISASVKEVWKREGYRESYSKKLSANWADSEYRAEQTALIRAGHRTPEYRAKASKLAKEAWAHKKSLAALEVR